VGKNGPLASYRATQIKTASQTTLIVMLYDEAIKHVKSAEAKIGGSPGSVEETSRHIVRAQDIVTELMAALDFDQGGDIAKSLFSLYLFVHRQLLSANVKKEAAPLTDVRQILEELRSAWVQLATRSDVQAPEASANGLNIAG